jgi:GT2 family glycosyltransferase
MSEVPISAFVVTFRRSSHLPQLLDRLEALSPPLSRIIVVENGGVADDRVSVSRRQTLIRRTANLGPAGAGALAAQDLATEALAGEWILRMDDDAVSVPGDLLNHLRVAIADRPPHVAAIGFRGTGLNRLTGRLNAVSANSQYQVVDSLSGGAFPLFEAAAVRAAGFYDPSLFFGFEELELGLRWSRLGLLSMIARADSPLNPILDELRIRRSALGQTSGKRRDQRRKTLWKEYYRARNMLWILRQFCSRRAEVRRLMELVAGPVARGAVVSVDESRALGLRLQGIGDALRGQLGFRVDPRDFLGGDEMEPTP